jgi:hypothetical protein
MNPFSGLSPALVRMEKALPADEVAFRGEEPAEVAEPAEAPAAEPIVIPEDEPIPAAEMPVLPDELCPAAHEGGFVPGTECPPGDCALAGPAQMRRCEEACDGFERIGIDFNDPETLPMPRSEEEAEEHGAGCPLGGCGDKLLRMFEKMIKRAVRPAEGAAEEQECKPECHEDAYRHHHHQGCTYPGRGCPGMYPCRPPAAKPEENPEEKPEGGKSALLNKIRRFKVPCNDLRPVHHTVDTMEYRPTDRTLKDFKPGPL